MKRQRKTKSLNDRNFGKTDPHLEEVAALTFAELVSFRSDLGLRLHETLDGVRKPDKLSKEEFRFVLEAVKDAERRFAAYLKALAWSTPLSCEATEVQSRPTTKKAKEADPDLPPPERLEPFADGTLRALDQYRSDLGLRQFQALEDARCPAGKSLTEFEHLKRMLRIYQAFYSVRIEDLVDHHATCSSLASRDGGRRGLKRRTTS